MIQDLYEECGKYGQLARVIVPRPPVPSSAMELFGSNNYGKVSVGHSNIRLLYAVAIAYEPYTQPKIHKWQASSAAATVLCTLTSL